MSKQPVWMLNARIKSTSEIISEIMFCLLENDDKSSCILECMILENDDIIILISSGILIFLVNSENSEKSLINAIYFWKKDIQETPTLTVQQFSFIASINSNSFFFSNSLICAS
ncbi:hypothetical protein F8M41_008276 [Gigaspora margarita]|uniref:Uncharacterized protein n=1 Tax=Gigaspora margarita TaxID=4874 RepID=A0A8H4A3R6_GIGMA|nr:hypothetical protein F8M41_008276 [Gigaspora margarita]